jgi:hypothetical protein
MTALLESMTWWPWPVGPIRNVRHQSEAPGMVTLRWRTPEPVPTLLARPDGSPLFHDEQARTEHQVTLTGWAGRCEDIVIRAGRETRRVAVAF